VDDWLGHSNDLGDLCDRFEEFLRACLDNNITLNTHKTKFGHPPATFFGFTVDADGTRLADKHVDPIKAMVPPADVSELRRRVGVFVVSRKHVRSYAMITKPLADLLHGLHGNKPVFEWTAKQQKAFDHIHGLLLGGMLGLRAILAGNLQLTTNSHLMPFLKRCRNLFNRSPC
jgi:hypothetical protein